MEGEAPGGILKRFRGLSSLGTPEKQWLAAEALLEVFGRSELLEEEAHERAMVGALFLVRLIGSMTRAVDGE